MTVEVRIKNDISRVLNVLLGICLAVTTLLCAIRVNAEPTEPVEEEITEPVTEEAGYWLETADGCFWYENGKRQGVYGDPKNITDTIYGVERGREIFDPASDAWYWLDADNCGAAAFNKEVWFPYVYQWEEPGSTEGKWVRYDFDGSMVKYFCLDTVVDYDSYGYPCYRDVLYYYDGVTGAMAKGLFTFEDRYDPDNIVHTKLFFDRHTGCCLVYQEVLEALGQLHGDKWPLYDVRKREYTTVAEYLKRKPERLSR